MNKREVISVILLSIFTCGIYSIYWYYVTTEEMNDEDKTGENLQNFLVALLLSIVTCGIYGIYWYYKFYKKADYVVESDNYIICFILQIIGFGIVSQAITQSAINSYIERKNNLINL